MPDLFSNDAPNLTLVPDNFSQAEEFLSLNGKAKELGRQIDWVFTQRKTEYLNEIINLKDHKSVAVRRKIASGLGQLAGKETLPQVRSWQETEADHN